MTESTHSYSHYLSKLEKENTIFIKLDCLENNMHLPFVVCPYSVEIDLMYEILNNIDKLSLVNEETKIYY